MRRDPCVAKRTAVAQAGKPVNIGGWLYRRGLVLSFLRPLAAVRLDRLVAALFVLAVLSPCAAGEAEEAADGGKVVTALDPRLRVVFQARDGAHWFGSNGAGVFRYDGKKIVRFAREHGLVDDEVRAIQEDAAGNLYVSGDGGVSRFDGRAFHALPVADASKSEWKLLPGDLWFAGPQDTGSVYRCDGKELFRLPLPKTKRGEAFVAMHPRSKYPNIHSGPYDVYTVFKDSRGHVWFGTANLGACRYDGTSFAWIAETEFGFGEYSSAGTRSILEDKGGRIWISKTLNRFFVDVPPPSAPSKGDVAPLSYRKEPGLGEASDPFSDFMSALKAPNGDLWFATLGAGVWRYDGTHMTRYPVKHDDSDIWIYFIYRDHQDILWVGTTEHGVYRFDGKAFLPFKP